ncbi:stealth family protein, partial [Aliiroseovarius sp. S2029]|uniref:stealth family protein n=1 Tax=Aliiroseovarius sp. S2029 TaxID=2936988 RepID=UPI0020BEF008
AHQTRGDKLSHSTAAKTRSMGFRPMTVGSTNVTGMSLKRGAHLTQQGSGVDKESVRSSLEALIAEHTHQYFRLEDESGHFNILVGAKALLPLIQWIRSNPSLSSHLCFRRSQPPRHVSGVEDVSSLKDSEILQISSLEVGECGISLYFYNQTSMDGRYSARSKNAPLRHMNFDNLTEPYVGFCRGDPVCVISSTKFEHPSQNVQPTDFAGELTSTQGGLGPIDVVYTWVDSSDPVWQAKFAKHVGKTTTTTHASALRFMSREELRFSLRSVLKHAPWVRNIFIVTDEQTPDWFKGSDRIKIVSHREIFPDVSVLPVFNSHAIESCLHRIPGLSEHFLYFNDDVFLGKPVTPEDFFGSDGSQRLFFSPSLSHNPDFVKLGNKPTDAAFLNTVDIIEKRFRMTPIAKVLHTPHPMRKSVLRMIEAEHPERFSHTRSARIRSDTDLNTTGNLAYYYILGLGLADRSGCDMDEYRYIDTGQLRLIGKLQKLRRQPTKFFCLNQTSHHEIPLNRQAQLMWLYLRLLFPRRGKHERSLFYSLRKYLPRFRGG